MPYEEALTRARSFEALAPHLRAKRILARYNELRTWPELEVDSGPGEIPSDWWDEARIDPATGRVILKKPDLRVFIRNISSEGDLPGKLIVHPGREVCALGLEFERTPVETLFPAAPESTSPKLPRPASVTTPLARKKLKGKKTAVGAKESAVWVELVAYLKAKFPGKPYPQSNVSFNAAKNWLLDNKKALLAESTIRAGLKRHLPKWPRNSNRR